MELYTSPAMFSSILPQRFDFTGHDGTKLAWFIPEVVWLILSKPPRIVYKIPPEEVARGYEQCKADLRINEAWAMQTNLEQPLIISPDVGPVKTCDSIIIDGTHRMFKAAKLKTHLYCVLLTAEESTSLLIPYDPTNAD